MEENETRVEENISETTVLALPSSVVSFYVPNKDRTVIVADTLGNWLVVKPKMKHIYDKLASGKTIGEVLKGLSPSEQQDCIALLSQIYARSFFSISQEVATTSSTQESVFFFLTYACNLKCSHCYMFKATNREAPLSLEEYGKIFEELARYGVKSVTFSGGEPLLHPHFEDLVRMAKGRAFTVTVLSNGTKWTEKLISFAKDNIDEVQISVDGIDESSCSCVRGPNVFGQAVETAIALANSGVITSVATTPVNETLSEIERGYQVFASELARRTNEQIIFRIASKLLDGRSCGHSDSFAATAEKLSNQIYTNEKCRAFSINHQPNNGLRSCGWGSVSFSPDGFAFPCNRVCDCDTLGSVRHLSLDELFQKAKEMSLFSDVEHTEPCCQCALRYLCGGGCRLDDFEFLSKDSSTLSIHKKCSSEKKRRILETMIDTTDYLYSF